jgi:hypothetical protein
MTPLRWASKPPTWTEANNWYWWRNGPNDTRLVVYLYRDERGNLFVQFPNVGSEVTNTMPLAEVVGQWSSGPIPYPEE